MKVIGCSLGNIRQMFLLLNLYHSAVNQFFCIIVGKSSIPDGAITAPDFQIALRQLCRLVL